MVLNYTKVAYLALFFLLCSQLVFPQDNWTWLNPKPMGSTINSCAYFPGTNILIAVGKTGTILRSTDNGANWQHIQSNVIVDLGSVSLPTSLVGYASGGNATLLKTTDGGLSWSVVGVTGVTGLIYQIHFVSESTGFLRQGGSTNKLYRTTDGGINWTDLGLDGSNGNLNTMYATSASEIIIGTSTGLILKSQSPLWSTVSTLYPFSGSPQVSSVTGYLTKMVAVADDGQIAYSHNAGTSWSLATVSPSNLNLYGVAFISENNLIAFSQFEELLLSSDAGKNWSKFATLPSEQTVAATSDFLANGILLGTNGIQYNTSNSGLTWAKSTSSETVSNLTAICATDGNIVYVGGAAGTLLKSTDGGGSWSSIAPPNNADITDVKLDPNNKLFFTTSYGRVYSSIDGGTSWDSSTNLSTRSLQEISFGSPTQAVTCGINNGTTRTVFYTIDGGSNWILSTSPTASIAFNSVFFVPNTQVVYICGSSGRVNKSNNGGAYWMAKVQAGSSNLNSILFLNELTGFVVGDNGYIAKTIDSATTWNRKADGLTTYNLQSIRFFDSQNGIIVGSLGTILKTTDGGETWSKSAQLTDNNLMSATLINSTTTLVSGNKGVILKSTNAPLPVELTSFSARVSGNTVTLLWETKTEIDNYGFEIERKTATSTWEKIGFVEGHSTTNSPKYYNFTDSPRGSGKFQYRLKQIDNDGAFEHSSVVEVDLSGLLPTEIEIKNFPNPFNPATNINIRVPETSETTIELHSITGEKLVTFEVGKLEAGTTKALKLDGTGLPSGIYIIHVTAGKHRKSHKIMLMK